MKSLKVIKLFTSIVVIGTLSLGTWAFAEVVINKEAPKESGGKVSEMSSLVKGNSVAEPVATVAVVEEVSTTEPVSVVASASIAVSGDMTLEELKNFNGQNGQAAYIAVEGTIYDVTKLGAWSNGTHNGYSAGVDLTDAFAKSPHTMSILSSAIVVGSLVDITTTTPITTPTSEVTTQNESTSNAIQNPDKANNQAVVSQSYDDEDHDEEYDEDHDEEYDEDHDEDHDEEYDEDHDEDHESDHDNERDDD